MAQSRLQAVYDHLRGSNLSKIQSKSPDDGASYLRRMNAFATLIRLTFLTSEITSLVVITAALRTPLCKSKKGQYKDTSSDELLLSLFKATRKNIGIDPALIDDMCVPISPFPLRGSLSYCPADEPTLTSAP